MAASDFVRLPTNPLYRNIFLRTLSHASSLGADSGECFSALHDASPPNPASWMAAWSTLATRLDQHAARLLESKHPQRVSAKSAYLRATNYHRTAFAHQFGHPMDEKAVLPAYKAMSASFANAARLFDPPLIPLKITFRDVNLSGYLATPLEISSKDRLLVVIGGYDAPMEEMYFFCGHHALSRGFSVLIFDGPGQGGALLESNLKLSHCYDEVFCAALDAVAQHGRWKHTVLMGLSLGGLLCLQAVASPKNHSRVHAVIADPGELNLMDAFRSRLPFPQSTCDQLPEGPTWAAVLLGFILQRVAASNGMAGWALRRGMLVHGCESPISYVGSLKEFDNEPILGQIKIPTLITRAEKDEIGDQAEKVFEKLISCDDKALMVFRDDEGAGDHCETGARMLFSEKVYAWLEEVLARLS